MKRRIAVVGGGWAGLAAAVKASTRGWQVSLYEMAPQLGGRARNVVIGDDVLDNGQHILIGAYLQTLALMRKVGVDPEAALLRMPLTLVGPDGRGLVLPRGAAMPAFARGVMAHPQWSFADRCSLLATAVGWAVRGFRCAPSTTVSQLCGGLGAAVRDDLIEPLCVAALNTPARDASAVVFLRVLKDALFSGAGSSDLLLPRRRLGELLPAPAAAWLRDRGAAIHTTRRVNAVAIDDAGAVRIDGDRHDAVVIATSAVEAARLVRPHAPHWSDRADALRYQPIVTVTTFSEGAGLPQPMIALPGSDDTTRPAQYVFDLGRLGGRPGAFSFVVSGAAAWVERGLDATREAVLAQAEDQLAAHLPGKLEVLHTLTEKRATFACTPGLDRPPQAIVAGVVAAGDYCAGPYPATLEGAVRSGHAAIDLLA